MGNKPYFTKYPQPSKARRGGVLHEADLDRMDSLRHAPKLPKISEESEQKAVIEWAAYNRGKWPCLERLYHTPNGGYRNTAEAAHLKRMGVSPGVPDLFLPFPVGDYSGLWLEMKTEEGRPTACQRDWIEYLRSVGYCAYVCHGAGEAINAIEDYLNRRTETTAEKVARLEKELQEAREALEAEKTKSRTKPLFTYGAWYEEDIKE